MRYREHKEIYGKEWFEKYHKHVILNSRTAYTEELIMDYCWASGSYLYTTYWWGRVPPHKAPLDTATYLQRGMWNAGD